MGTSSAIRAGRAFVEMVIDDETVQASLDSVKAKLKSFGAAVDSVSTSSFSRMGTTAVASTAATTSGVAVLTTGMAFLGASVYAVGNAFRVVFTAVTGSVLKAVAGVGALAVLVSKLAPKSQFAGLLNGFLSKSQTTEAIGRWTRFFGTLTGSSAISDLGKRIERLGLGSAIVKGFQGGLFSGISATLGAGIRSAKSVVAGAISNVFTAPFRLVGGLARGAFSVVKSPLRSSAIAGTAAAAGASPLAGMSTSAGLLANNLQRSAGGGRNLAGAMTLLKSVGGTIAGLAVKVGGFAAAISGPALLAAKSFVTSSVELINAAKETGESLASLAYKKYGGAGLVSTKDITAAAKLSAAFTELKQSTSAAWAQIGIAALPVLKAITDRTIKWMDAVGSFLSQNRQLVTAVVEAAVKIAGASAAVVSLYGAFRMAVPIIAALMSPLGLVLAGVAGIAYAFPKLRNEAIETFKWLFGQFSTLGKIVNETMQGIMDSMSGGSLKAAARVLWAGLNIAWTDGCIGLRQTWQQAITFMSGAFIGFYAAIMKGWTVTTKTFMDIWTQTQNFIARGMAQLIALWNGQSVEEVLATLQQMQAADNGAREKAANKRLGDIEKERQAMMQANQQIDAAKMAALIKEREAAQKEFEDAKKAAAALRAAKAGAPDINGAKGMKDTATLGTFSLATVGRTNIGGLSNLTGIAGQQLDELKQIKGKMMPGGGGF